MTRPARVMHVVPWPVYGGPHNEALLIGMNADRKGWSLTTVLPQDGRAAARRLETQGLRVVQLPMTRLRRTRSLSYWACYPANFLVDVYRLARLMGRDRILLVEGSSVNLQPAIAARISGAAVVWRVADISAPALIRRAIGLLVPFLADAVLVNGRATLPAYPGLSRAAGRLSIYYPMIDDSAFNDMVLTPRVRGTEPVVGMVANINPDKGIEVFVEAAGLLAGRREVRFILVGAEHDTHRAYARRIRERVLELGLEDRFEFAGEQSNVGGWMRRMDVFVISSHREGTTTTAIEAMASSLPVVATMVGAVGEVVADGKTGLLVPPANPSALAAAVALLLDDDAYRRRLALEGRKRFEEHFALAGALSERMAAYRRAVARMKRRRHIKRPSQ